MDFTDMLTEMITSETTNLDGVEIVSTTPDELTVDEELIP